jgi:hypothetical protein
MENENNNELDILNEEVEIEEDENLNDDEQPEQDDSEVIELRKKIKTIEAQKEHWRKKASTPIDKKTETVSELSSKDLLALMKSEINEDDIDDVVEYAKFKKISISEALKTSTIKAIISEKSEYRKTAELTSTRNTRQSNTKVSDNTLLKKFSDGDVPEAGSDEAERLFWARRGGKR